MSSSEDDDDGNKKSSAFDFANAIMFGNIDNRGVLTDDILDEDSKKLINSLHKHLATVVPYSNIIDNEEVDKSSDELANGDDNSNEGMLYSCLMNQSNLHLFVYQGVSEKDDLAVDYSDINEMVEDEDKILQELSKMNSYLKHSNDDDDDYDAPKKSEDQYEKDKDGFVLPKTLGIKVDEKKIVEKSETENKIESNEVNKKRLDTPLAAMLPSKYADLDVTELFPAFRRNKVLRFSRLFGLGKKTSLPQIWKNVKSKKKPNADNKLLVQPSKNSNIFWEFDVCPPENVPQTCIEVDDEWKLLQNEYFCDSNVKNHHDNSDSSDVADWRYGPAQSWYDMLKVPENGEGFDYGFKLKEESKDKEEVETESVCESPVQNDPDDAFTLVTQLHWENDIIWNADEIKPKILAKLNDKHLASGWLPSGHNRTASAFTQQMRSTATPIKTTLPPPSLKKNDKKSIPEIIPNEKFSQENTWFSIFPIENEELIYNLWENDVIWDAECMEKIPTPRVLTLDRNDDNIILELPDEEETTEVKANQPAKEKKDQIRKSRLLLGKAGVIAEPEIISPPSPTNDKDPYNISNDEYYMQRTVTGTSLKTNVGSNLIQHSIPALELRQPFFPTHLNYQRLRAFHRPSLKKYSHGMIANTLPHGVNPLVKHIKRKAKLREQERIASGGGEMFFMRTPEDLTGKDGDLILTEYSEEHPPLIMQVGMASKVKNYYKRVSRMFVL